jgi:SAM-dependent methyltransferase
MNIPGSRNFKNFVNRSVMTLLPRPVADRLLTAKQRLWWRTVERSWHQKNVAGDGNSEALAAAVSFVRNDEVSVPVVKVLEFGCNAANNLDLLRRDAAAGSIVFCGADLNPHAIAVARRSFPSDSFHVGDHKWFIRNARSLGSFDLFIASHVLYYVDEQNTRAILEAARSVARYVLVIDIMDRFEQETGARTGLFVHPYGIICRDTGLEVLTMKSSGQYGYFVARTRQVGYQPSCDHSLAEPTKASCAR